MCPYFVTGLVSSACADAGRLFLGIRGWGESSSSGVTWRYTSSFYGLARGLQENYTQILGVSLPSGMQPSLSDVGQGLSENISPTAV